MKLNNIQREAIRDNSMTDILDSIGIQTNEDTIREVVEDVDRVNSEALAKDKNAKLLSVDTNVKSETKKFVCSLSKLDREAAVNSKLIPEHYMNVSFDEAKIRENLIKQHQKSKGLYTIYNFQKYITVCIEILNTIRSGQLPRRSWIIGAPNGFGKSSLVNECLITLKKHNMNVAPYISLHELASIRVEEEQRLMKPFSYKATQGIYEKNGKEYLNPEYAGYNYLSYKRPEDIIKKPTIIESAYSWSEYINASCLFVHFTDTISKDLESHVLYQLLSIRGSKGLPTIAFISTSLEPYTRDIYLKELVWDEILDYDSSNNCYDRVSHISCYKTKNLEFNKASSIDKETGIAKNE